MSKTEHLTTGQKTDILLNDTNIKTVEELKYLGPIIHENGSRQRDVERRIGEVRKAIAMLNSVMWNSNILPKTKRLIYNAIVQSNLLYVPETWTFNLQLKKKLPSTEMGRTSARKSRMDKIRNSRIHEIIKVKQNVVNPLAAQPESFAGNVKVAKFAQPEIFSGIHFFQ